MISYGRKPKRIYVAGSVDENVSSAKPVFHAAKSMISCSPQKRTGSESLRRLSTTQKMATRSIPTRGACFRGQMVESWFTSRPPAQFQTLGQPLCTAQEESGEGSVDDAAPRPQSVEKKVEHYRRTLSPTEKPRFSSNCGQLLPRWNTMVFSGRRVRRKENGAQGLPEGAANPACCGSSQTHQNPCKIAAFNTEVARSYTHKQLGFTATHQQVDFDMCRDDETLYESRSHESIFLSSWKK